MIARNSERCSPMVEDLRIRESRVDYPPGVHNHIVVPLFEQRNHPLRQMVELRMHAPSRSRPEQLETFRVQVRG
jgi:hypothetical protein